MKEWNDHGQVRDSTRNEGDSPLVVSVLNRQRTTHIDTNRIRRIVTTCLHRLNVRESEVCIVLVSDRSIQQLNWQYLCRRGPTDVIAFSPGDGPRGEGGAPILGDVVISMETASRQAQRLGTSLEEELDVLVVHGLLHLLGYEHTGTRKEAQRMWKKQRSLVDMLKRCPSHGH